jgi:hypothetical protein
MNRSINFKCHFFLFHVHFHLKKFDAFSSFFRTKAHKIDIAKSHNSEFFREIFLIFLGRCPRKIKDANVCESPNYFFSEITMNLQQQEREREENEEISVSRSICIFD